MNYNTLFYDDPAPAKRLPRSMFLIGPSVGRETGLERTPWREEVLEALRAAVGADGLTVIVPEFRAGGFRRFPFDDGLPSGIPGMERASERLIEWETAGIDNCAVVLAWMPFRMGVSAADPESRPGFSTRVEVARLIESGRRSIVLGMPTGAFSGGQIRYLAHKRGHLIHAELGVALQRAVELALDPLAECRRQGHSIARGTSCFTCWMGSFYRQNERDAGKKPFELPPESGDKETES